MQITLNVPEQFLIDESPAELARRVQLYAAVLMFRAGEISAGAATEFAGVDRLSFLAECQRHGVAAVCYSPSELAHEVASLR